MTAARAGEVRVGIVGLGSAGRQHLAAIERAPGVRAVAGCDPAAGVPAGLRSHPRISDLLADPEVDLVALCVPPGPRAQLAEQVAAAGRALLVEKPPACSSAELAGIQAACTAAGVPASVMLQHRMRLPAAAIEHDWGAQGGGILEVSRPRSGWYYQQAGWRRDPDDALGGVTAHLGVHYLDLACQLLGEVRGVTVTGIEQRYPGIETRAAGTVDFAAGAALAFLVTSAAGHRRERLAVFGPNADLVLSDGTLTGQLGGVALAARSSGDVTDLRAEVYLELASALRTGNQPERCGLASAGPVTAALAGIAEAVLAATMVTPTVCRGQP